MSLIASTATLTNVIIAETPTAAYASGSLGFVMNYSDASGADFLGVGTGGGTGNITADPMFAELTGDGDASNDDLSLLPGSPCLDSGDPALFDADGSRSDMGADVP